MASVGGALSFQLVVAATGKLGIGNAGTSWVNHILYSMMNTVNVVIELR